MSVTEKPESSQATGWRVEQVPAQAVVDGMAEAGDRWIIGGKLDEVLATVHGSSAMDVDELAALFSAAAEMKAALKGMLASYDGVRTVVTSDVVLAKIVAADAALAKAERRV